MDKTLLRDQYRRRLRAISAADRQAESRQIAQKLSEYLHGQSGYWSLYYPLDDEPNLLECVEQCPQVQWVFPRVRSTGDLSFFQVQSLGDMAANSWGLVQPDPEVSTEIPARQVAGYIIPALAYDSFGVRLGRGGGYYDQTLKSLSGLKVGVIYSSGVSPDPLPREDHDQCMDVVVSAKQWLNVKEVPNGYN